jgi:ABC-type multidrug transport system fused ATPase/permease subunit
MIVAIGLELLIPWPVKWLIDCVLGEQPFPGWLARIWEALQFAGPLQYAGGLALMTVVVALGHKGLQALSQHFLIRAGNRMVLQLRRDLIQHLFRLSLKFHDKSRVGDLLYRAAYDTQTLQMLLCGAIVPLLTGTLTCFGIAAVMLTVSIPLTLVALATAPVVGFLIHSYGRRIEGLAADYHKRESGLASTIQESLGSIRTIKAFTLEEWANRSLDRQAGECLEANQRKVVTELKFSTTVGVAMALGSAAVIWLGARAVLAGQLHAGDIVVFLSYVTMLYQPLSSVSYSTGVARSSLAQLRRLHEILDEEPEVRTLPGALKPAVVRGEIDLQSVSFRYEDDQSCLEDINLHIAPGQVVGLVGKTGSGKSTLVHLLMRFYDPDNGRLTLDGHELPGLDLQWLRQQFAIVMQDPLLFSGTIRENIGYGRQGATDAEIEEAARLAQADEFIRQLPKGFESVLGERGVNLSGGQRQRLSIARAFLKNSPILILDEPTSALDPATEEALLSALEDLMKGRTTLIIAHRLSTLRRADLVLVLEQGRMVECGAPAELLGKESRYRDLHNSQFGRTD